MHLECTVNSSTWIKFGHLFRSLMKFCYSKSGKVCWNCGRDCGFMSHYARNLLWCDSCYSEWKFVIEDLNFEIDWKGIRQSK